MTALKFVLLARHRRAKWIAEMLTLCLIWISGSAWCGTTSTSDSSYALDSALARVYWINNDEILFNGFSWRGLEAGGAAPKVQIQLHIWNVRTNAVKKYADADRACFFDGMIEYYYRSGSRLTRMYGPIHAEKDVGLSPSEAELRAKKDWVLRTIDCRAVLRSTLTPPQDGSRIVAVLRERDGYLDLGPKLRSSHLVRAQDDTTNGNVKLYPRTSIKAIILPIEWEEEVRDRRIKYSTYSDAYVVAASRPRGSTGKTHGDWPSNRAQPIYVIKSSGHVDIHLVPPGRWTGAFTVDATRDGILFNSDGVDPGGADRALYHLQGSQVTKVLAGSVVDFAVNPDGCRVAVGIKSDWLKPRYQPTRLILVNVCNSK